MHTDDHRERSASTDRQLSRSLHRPAQVTEASQEHASRQPECLAVEIDSADRVAQHRALATKGLMFSFLFQYALHFFVSFRCSAVVESGHFSQS